MNDPDTAQTELISAHGDGEAIIRAFRLSVLSGPDAGAVFQSTGDRVVVGSHDSADFVLSDRTVSRFHCEFSVDDTGVQLRDLDSRNGTKLDNALVQEVRLRGPIRLTLGSSELRYEEVSEDVRIPLAPDERLGEMIGASNGMRAIFSLLSRAASTNAHMLIEGEPGVGKALAAATVHDQSERAEGPFGVVDCSTPDDVVRHDLFGDAREPGALELCDKGTLVLEDLGALSEELQSELQRALDQTAVRRGVDRRVHPFDTRVIATSRRNLRRDVNVRRFRTVLFTTIAAMRVRIPPLRDRVFDIPVLISAFLEELGALESPAAAQLLSAKTIESLRGYAWPDNVRELKRYVERCVAVDHAVEPGGKLGADEPPVIDTSIPLRQAREEWLRYFERRYLADMLERTGGNVSAAARRAGMDRVHLHRLLKNAGLR